MRIAMTKPAMVVALVAASPVDAQPSRTCEFAMSAWVSAQVALSEARTDQRACLRQRGGACTAQQGRVRMIEQQLRLLRNYVEGYCRR